MNAVKTGNSPIFYFDNLDGLRFFAFLSVFISHAALFLGYEGSLQSFQFLKEYVLVNGDIGVSFFFVLSGFLITYLLFKEQDTNGAISLKKFYIRRVFRIWPVYFLTLITGFFVLPTVSNYFLGDVVLPFLSNPPLSFLPTYLFFMVNFSLAFYGGASVPTDVLWSISVEEQFYVVWPFLVSFFKRQNIPWLLVFIIICSSIYRFYYASSLNILSYSTFSVMSDLAVGSLLSWFVYTHHAIVARVKKSNTSFIFILYALIPCVAVGRHFLIRYGGEVTLVHRLLVVSIPLLLAFLYAFVIFEQNESSHSFYKMKNFKKFSFLGKISYGMYAYHMVSFSLILIIFAKVGVSIRYNLLSQWIVFLCFAFLGTYILALLSYIFMEKIILKYKPK